MNDICVFLFCVQRLVYKPCDRMGAWIYTHCVCPEWAPKPYCKIRIYSETWMDRDSWEMKVLLTLS